MSVVEVAAERPYSVFIESGAITRLPEQLGEATRVALVSTESVAQISNQVKTQLISSNVQLTELIIPDGEAAKTLSTAAQCWSKLAQDGFTRTDLIIGVGGGAVTDFAGFLAAGWLRGVDFISVPTTVLGMVDAAVGGKTGVNLPEGKNLVGAFHEPRAVLADLDALVTLPARDISSGLAEVVKAGFVADQRILDLVQDDLNAVRRPGDELAQLITWGVEFKARVVSGDLRERTSTQGHIGRELLNYGHTLGHAVERHCDFQLRHGEAISVGMVFAAELSRRVAGLADQDVELHREILASLGLPTSYQDASFDELADLMARDKKSRGNQLRFIGLASLQQPTLIQAPAVDDLKAAYQVVAS